MSLEIQSFFKVLLDTVCERVPVIYAACKKVVCKGNILGEFPEVFFLRAREALIRYEDRFNLAV